MGTEIRVGIFIIIGLAVLSYFLVNMGEWPFFGDKDEIYEVTCRFTNTVGLNLGAGVSLSGVKIGEVADIYLDGNRAVVVMAIDNKIEFPSTSKARITSVGLLGQASVEILALGNGLEPTARTTGEIGSMDPVTIDQLVAVLADISSETTELVKSVRDFLYGNEARIVDILDNLEAFTYHLEATVKENQESLKSSLDSIKEITGGMRADLPTILGDIKTLTASIREVIETREGDIDDSIIRTRSLLERLEKASTTMQEILDKVNEGEGAVGMLINEPDTVEKADQILDRIDTIIYDVENIVKSPSRLSFTYGFRTEYYIKSEDFKYYYQVTTSLNKNESITVELINDQIIDKPPVFRPGESGSSPQQIELLGNRFYFTATYDRFFAGGKIRLGIMEGETGLGLELGERDGNVTFSFLGYDFGREEGPHLKFSAHMTLWRDVFFTIGLDDPADDRRSQFFFGGGYRF